jgi:hypothetical protein
MLNFIALFFVGINAIKEAYRDFQNRFMEFLEKRYNIIVKLFGPGGFISLHLLECLYYLSSFSNSLSNKLSALLIVENSKDER